MTDLFFSTIQEIRDISKKLTIALCLFERQMNTYDESSVSRILQLIINQFNQSKYTQITTTTQESSELVSSIQTRLKDFYLDSVRFYVNASMKDVISLQSILYNVLKAFGNFLKNIDFVSIENNLQNQPVALVA